MSTIEVGCTPDDTSAKSGEKKSFFARVLEEVDRDNSREIDLAQLKVESERVALRLREMEASAKVAQEVAIAKRIENALEVEIEEFYDTTGAASLGLAKDQALTLGASASARLVSRRIIRFSGAGSDGSDRG